MSDKGKVLKIEEHRSQQGGQFFYVFFKMFDGTSAKTCLYPAYRNFPAWSFILQPSFNKDTLLEGLKFKGKGLLDADFPPRPARIDQTPLVTAPQRPISATQSSQAGLFKKTDETHHEGRDMYEKWRAESKRLKQEAGVK